MVSEAEFFNFFVSVKFEFQEAVLQTDFFNTTFSEHLFVVGVEEFVIY